MAWQVCLLVVFGKCMFAGQVDVELLLFTTRNVGSYATICFCSCNDHNGEFCFVCVGRSQNAWRATAAWVISA